MMKNLKATLAVAAMVFGLGASLATTAHPKAFANRTWGKDPVSGIYTEVTGLQQGTDYRCKQSTRNCTEVYPADVDPNNQAGDSHPGTALPISTVQGDFSL